MALEEENEEKQERADSRKKSSRKKGGDDSRGARYQRRQSKEEEEFRMEEDEEAEEKKESEEADENEELEGEKVDDDHSDFPSTSSSPVASSSSSSSSSFASSPSPATSLPDSMDRLDGQGRIYTSCTLVVCPVSLVGQWANELQEKSSRPLRILLYHGGSRPRKVPQLLNYDVIITSYGIAASELTLGNNRAKRLIEKTPWLYKGKYAPEYQSLLNRLHWHRVILDESHVIRTMNSIQCRAAYELVGDRVWMLTGTVVNTSLMDFKGQCKFLDLKGFSVGQVWTDVDNLLVQNKQYENRRADRSGKLRRSLLQKNRLKNLFVNLVTKSMIRHEKRQQFNGRPALISLPPKRVQTIIVAPTAEEKRAMDEMFQHAKARFEQYKADNVAVRRSVEVLQLLQPLRIACSAGTVDMVAHRERMKGELDRDAVRAVMDKVREKGSLTADKVKLASRAAISHLTDDCAICLTGDHSVLTRAGWQSIRAVQPGDEVLSFNIKRYVVEWKPVLSVTPPRTVNPAIDSDKLYRMQGSGMDIIATRDHRMLLARIDQQQSNGLQVQQPLVYSPVADLLPSAPRPLKFTVAERSKHTRFAHTSSRAVVCGGVNRQQPIKLVVPGLEQVCEWWWEKDRQHGFLTFIGFWLGDGYLDTRGGYVAMGQKKEQAVTWLEEQLLPAVFPRWWTRRTNSWDADMHSYHVRCPPLYNFMRKMAVGPLGYNPRDPTQLRAYPHFAYDEGLAAQEQQSAYYQADNSGGSESEWTESQMLRAFIAASAAQPESCWWCEDAECVDGDELVLCDGEGCQRGGHLSCAGLTALPKCEWLCPCCAHFTPYVEARATPADDVVVDVDVDVDAGGTEDDAPVADEVADSSGDTVRVPRAEAVTDAAEVRAAGRVCWFYRPPPWNRGWWIILNGHWFYLKRWLGDAQQMADVWSRLSQQQAAALLEGFCRADGKWANIKHTARGKPKGYWQCSNSSFPLIDQLMLIAQLAGAAVDLHLHTKAGKATRAADGRTLSFSVDHWQLFFSFRLSSTGLPFKVARLAEPVDVSSDVEARGYYQHQDDGKVYCLTVQSDGDTNANFLTRRLAVKRIQSGIHPFGVRAHPAFVGNCLDLLQEPLQTPCRHLFCAECIRGLLLSGRGAEKGTGQCPLCRADLSINQLYKPNVQEELPDDEEKEAEEDEEKESVVKVKKEPSVRVLKEKSSRTKKRKVVKGEEESEEEEEKKEAAPTSSSSSSSSSGSGDEVHFDSKLNKLMSELQVMRAAGPLHKALVFTQYLSTMELLKRTMKEQNITYQTLEGHMPMRQRKRNLEEFRSNPDCSVFLLSMRSGAVGLTLTAASHVFILEPAINPALEQQAIGRIHRLGNTHKEVVVNYLVMHGSVEENIMEINREKLELLEKQKRAEESRLARANGMRAVDEDDEDDANVRAAAGLDSDDENAGESAPAPRFGHHHTNANADSGAGINTVSQGSLVQDVALFRIGELDKLFKDRSAAAAAAPQPAAGRAPKGKVAVKKERQ